MIQSHTHTHTYIYLYAFSFIFFSIMVYHKTLNAVLCRTWFEDSFLITGVTSTHCFLKHSQSRHHRSVAQSCPAVSDPMDCSTPGFPVLHYLLEFVQTHVHWFSDAIQPSHPLSSPSPPAPNLPQHQDLYQWVGSLHHVTKVSELQLQDQSFQWIFGVDFL